jgi:hypothetical protein
MAARLPLDGLGHVLASEAKGRPARVRLAREQARQCRSYMEQEETMLADHHVNPLSYRGLRVDVDSS